jgi:hypothetical protein
VFALAADILEHRGLMRLRAHEIGIWHRHQLPASDTRKGRTTTVGAIASACVHLDRIRAEVDHLAHFRRYAGVDYVAQVEDGRDTAAVVALLRRCAAGEPPS